MLHIAVTANNHCEIAGTYRTQSGGGPQHESSYVETHAHLTTRCAVFGKHWTRHTRFLFGGKLIISKKTNGINWTNSSFSIFFYKLILKFVYIRENIIYSIFSISHNSQNGKQTAEWPKIAYSWALTVFLTSEVI
jgi:hypothetical protein